LHVDGICGAIDEKGERECDSACRNAGVNFKYETFAGV
jgi:hypothetical protein